MLNLAPLFYRAVQVSDGGPIERIVTVPWHYGDITGQQAIAYLQRSLFPPRQEAKLYSGGDGGGFHPVATVARYMAISEALERWAYYVNVHGSDASKYGFDQENSTTGMAAFPSIFSGPARSRAFLEALERWAVISWWDGRIGVERRAPTASGVEVLRLLHGGPSGEVVLLHHQTATGHYSYAHAAAKTIEQAVGRALVELSRSGYVLSSFEKRATLADVVQPLERRTLFFASQEGHQEFERRLRDGVVKPAPSWELLCDREVVGPWSKYAKVWRVLPDMPTREHLDPHANFFFL